MNKYIGNQQETNNLLDVELMDTNDINYPC